MRAAPSAVPSPGSTAGSNPSRRSSASSAPQAAAGPRALAGLDAPRVPGVGGVVGIGADALGQRGEQAGEQRVGRRVEPEPGRAGGEEVEVLRPPDRAAVDRLDVDQPGLAQPLEVQPDGVGVQAEAVGELLGRERRGRRGQLPVHRVTGLVAQCLQHREVHQVLDRSRGRAYFQGVRCFYSDMTREPATAPPSPTPRAADPDDRAPVHEPSRPGTVPRRRPPHARGRDRPRARTPASSTSAWSTTSRSTPTATSPSRSRSRRPAARSARQIKKDVESKVRGLPGVTAVDVHYGEMTQEQKTAAMQRARWNARENAPTTEVPVDDPRPRDREREGRRRQVLGHREPRRRARRARAAPSASSTPTSGASASRACSASTAGSRRQPTARSIPTRCTSRTARSRRRRSAQGRVDGLPRRRREHRAHVARADPHQGARAVPHRRPLGRPRLPARRHAARAPATSRWVWPGCSRRPRCSSSRRRRSRRRRSRRGSPTWPAART